MKHKIWIASLSLAMTLMGGLTHAQSREGTIQAAVGPGIAFNPPVRFDLDFGGEYFLNDEIAFGFNFDVFIRGGAAYGFLPFAHYHFDLLEFPRFAPYVGGGMGFWVGSNGNAAFDLMAPAVGFEYELTPRLFIGPDASFHLLMGDKMVGGSTSWDLQIVARIGYRF